MGTEAVQLQIANIYTMDCAAITPRATHSHFAHLGLTQYAQNDRHSRHSALARLAQE
jgi:hypothetical protein